VQGPEFNTSESEKKKKRPKIMPFILGYSSEMMKMRGIRP
jgi:hypothetical protein